MKSHTTKDATKEIQEALREADDIPQRLTKDRHLTRSNYVDDRLPHEAGTAYGLDFELWYCRNTGLPGLEDFILLRVHLDGKLVPGRRRVRGRFREDQFHLIDARNHKDTRKELWRRLFRLYWKHVRSEPETPLQDLRSKLREIRREKERDERRKREKEKHREHIRRKAQRMFGRPPELLRGYHMDAAQNMRNRMAKKSPAHR